MASGMTYLDEPDRVLTALSPLRRKLLNRLRDPSSATQLAAALGLPRQRVNYHLRTLEAAGLVELVELRQRRGFIERIVRAKPGAVVVDPTVMRHDDRDEAAEIDRIQDQYAAEHLVEAAATTVRDVARMQVKADETGKKLLTFTIEAEARFADPASVHRFTDELADTLRQLLARYDQRHGRAYRIVAGGYPAARASSTSSTSSTSEAGSGGN
jgi:DNA-binding transcriptional ArsR family regulator